MDTQTLSLLCGPLIVAAAAFFFGKRALNDITQEGLNDDDESYTSGELTGWEENWRDVLRNGKDLEQIKVEAGNRKNQGLREDGYVMDRIGTIYEALNPNHSIRKVPSLSDLRALSEQRAQSSFDANFFRAFTPSILVLGIGCTLLGVHCVLSRRVIGDQMMILLGEALCPGAVAVVCTIALFVLRVKYNRKYASLIRALDRLTLRILLPHFQGSSPTLHYLNEKIGKLNTCVGGGTEQGGMNLKEGMQKFGEALTRWTEVSDGCMETLTHAAEQMCSIGKNAQKIQERDGAHIKEVDEMLADARRMCSIRKQNAQTLLTKIDPVLSSLREISQGISEQYKSYKRITAQGNKLREILPTMSAGQAALLGDAQNCAQLVQWLQELSDLTAHWKGEAAGIHELFSHLIKQPLSVEVEARMRKHSATLNQIRQKAEKNVASLRLRLSRIEKQTRSYEKKIQGQNERCRKILSGSLYPVGLLGVYMRITDTFCRVRWWLYAIVAVLILIFV